MIFRQHCIENRPGSVLEITAWAQERFQESLTVNTAHRDIHRCRLKLHQAEKKPDVNMIQELCHLLWTKARLKWTESGSDGSEPDAASSRLKRSGTIQLVISSQFKASISDGTRGALVPLELETCTSGKAPSMLKGMF